MNRTTQKVFKYAYKFFKELFSAIKSTLSRETRNNDRDAEMAKKAENDAKIKIKVNSRVGIKEIDRKTNKTKTICKYS